MTDETAKPSRIKALTEKFTRHEKSGEASPNWVGYVALTRGMKRVTISHCAFRHGPAMMTTDG